MYPVNRWSQEAENGWELSLCFSQGLSSVKWGTDHFPAHIQSRWRTKCSTSATENMFPRLQRPHIVGEDAPVATHTSIMALSPSFFIFKFQFFE